MELEALSIQELRQTLRERGANSRGSKKQLLARVAEQYGLTPATAAVAPAAKVRVSIQKSRSACCALLVDPSLPPEHNLQLLLRKAATKFRFKPLHLIVIGVAPSAGGGVELHAGNLNAFLKDGLTVLASVFPASAQSPTAVSALAGPTGDEAEAGMAALQLGPSGSSNNGGADSSRAHGADSHSMQASESKEESQRSRLLTDSGSCSSEYEHDHDHEDAANELAERASLKSFDSDSLYSFSAAELHPHAAVSASAPGLGYSQQTQHPTSGSSGSQQVSSRGWRWMLPKASDQQQQSSAQVRPPPHPHSPLLQPASASASASVIAVPAFSALPLSLASHAHRNHRCQALSAAPSSSSSSSDAAAAASSSAAAASSSSAAAAAAPSCAASSVPSSAPHLPSIMDELNALSRSKPPPARSAGACECCDAGCELDFSIDSSSRPASPVIHSQLQPPPPQHSYLLQRSHSTPTASSSLSASPDSAAATAGSPSPMPPGASSSPPASASAAASSSAIPPTHPGLLPSYSSSSLDALRAGLGPNPDESVRRLLSALADAEKRARRSESALKAQQRSESELRAQLAALSQDSSRFEALHSQYRSAQLSLDLREKDTAKLQWERDRLRLKNKTLMERNNELKADSESLAALRKEHAQLTAAYARLSGQNVNASTSPAVLQELLLHHAGAIERVHKQMAANLASERAALKESRSCKVCMSKPCDTILLPCSHFVLCGACAASIVKCPICRDRPQDKRPVYM